MEPGRAASCQQGRVTWEPITSGMSDPCVHLRGTGKVEAMELFVCFHRVGATLFLSNQLGVWDDTGSLTRRGKDGGATQRWSLHLGHLVDQVAGGGESCEWAAWFRAQHEGWSWAKAPSGFDLVGWQLAHTAGVNECRAEWEERGYTVYTESQNGFALRGRTATLGGKPDLIALSRASAGPSST